MPQSSLIFFYLMGGFLAWITMRGELPAYAAVLTGNVNTAGAAPSTVTSGTNPTVNGQQVASNAGGIDPNTGSSLAAEGSGGNLDPYTGLSYENASGGNLDTLTGLSFENA